MTSNPLIMLNYAENTLMLNMRNIV